MANKKLLIRIVILMLVITFIDRIGGRFYWDYTLWWFDMVMHFLGGIWVGLFFIYTFSRKISPMNLSFQIILKVMLSVLLIGIIWEVFEFYVHNVIGPTPFSISDTLSDICFDLAGGFLAIFYFFYNIMPHTENAVQLK